jgi:hypothetical protein
MTHTLWLWGQGFLALVVVVLALPGRRRDMDDDLPEEGLATAAASIPAQAAVVDGLVVDGFESAGAAEPSGPEPYVPHQAGAPEPDPYGAVPQVPHQQQGYEEWNGYAYPAEYDPYAGQYQPQPPYPGAEYGNNGEYAGYPDGTYQGGEYADPYGYQQPAPPYDPAHDAGEFGHRRDGSDQQ